MFLMYMWQGEKTNWNIFYLKQKWAKYVEKVYFRKLNNWINSNIYKNQSFYKFIKSLKS